MRAPSFDDLDTLTLAECWPWFRGAIMILAGCTIAAVPGLSGLSLASKRQQPSEEPEAVEGQNQGALDVIYAMVIAEVQQLVANLDSLDAADVPERICVITAISITPQ
jgi:hypothetical protein